MAQNYKKDYLWNTLGVFAQSAISPLLLILVTRLNGIHDSGVFSFAFSIAVIFWAAALWGGRTYQVSDASGFFSQSSYILMRIILSIVVLVAAYVFCLLNGYDLAKTSILMILVFTKVIEAMADVYYGVMQLKHRLYLSGRVMLIKYAIATAAFIAVDILTKDLLLSCISFAIVVVAFLVLVDIPFARRLDSSIRHGVVSKVTLHESLKIIKVLTPVFAVTLLAMFSLNIPRYFIDIHHQADIGHFGILAMPVTLIVLLVTFILQPNIVQLSTLFAQGRAKEFNKYVVRVCGITTLLGLGVLAGSASIGVPALELVFGVNFSSHYASLLVVVVAAMINALVGVLINILVIMRRLISPVIILIVTNAILVFVSAVIIPTGGLLSAMLLFMVANAVQLLALGVVYRTGIVSGK